MAAPLVCFGKALARANWLTKMAISSLENAGITDAMKPDESKAKAVLLASEKTGKDLYRQIYDITFVDKSGCEVSDHHAQRSVFHDLISLRCWSAGYSRSSASANTASDLNSVRLQAAVGSGSNWPTLSCLQAMTCPSEPVVFPRLTHYRAGNERSIIRANIVENDSKARHFCYIPMTIRAIRNLPLVEIGDVFEILVKNDLR
ncbi:hypothetical protein QZN01_20245 [Burkholderia cenocepacia]|uniref:hypothetical protein n=1 Tax=Burkholderia cenocepacia TaxID=95486 RepID=UPI0018D403EB|nr:hypothetical protein [Burkholderia cenocepacia]MDN7824986.1 hypothetical protein [Burkholderia cenocepacia]HEM8999114.1 hypothetical protein [Burkholderia cenocepacia]